MTNNFAISPQINILVCDPCPLITSGLQKSFEGDTRICIAGEISSLRNLRQRVFAGGVDIALVDWSMVLWHDRECMKVLGEIGSHAFLVLLGMSESTRERKQALDFGARGIISKRSTLSQIRKALYRVGEGGIWLEKSAAENLLNHVFLPVSGPQHELDRIAALTHREREVIVLVCRSLRNKEIASTLLISESTVWHHLTSIFSKLGLSDRVSLVTFAIRHSLNTYSERTASGLNSWPHRLGTPSLVQEQVLNACVRERITA